MTEPLRLAIVGSRVLTRKQHGEVVAHVTWEIGYNLFKSPEGVIIGSGGAEGVDTVAQDVAEGIAYFSPYVAFKLFLPKTKNWEGYKERNAAVGDWCDEMIVIRSPQSETFGSGWTGEYTEKLGKHVTWIALREPEDD